MIGSASELQAAHRTRLDQWSIPSNFTSRSPQLRPESQNMDESNISDQRLGSRFSSPYRPLDAAKSQIRVLILHPGLTEDPIRCELRIVSLDEDPIAEYETISYCWGDITIQTIIEVDGRTVQVPISAVQALRRFRWPGEDRTLWMDSVCINQADLSERSQQVAEMYRVYSLGQRNLIWLGEDDGTAGLALEGITSIMEEVRRETNDFRDLYTSTISPEGWSYEHPVSARFDRESLSLLFTRPWFYRLWIVQEAAVSPLNVCFCGPHEVPLLDIIRSATWIQCDSSVSESESDTLNADLTNVVRLGRWSDPVLGYYNSEGAETWKFTLFSMSVPLRGFRAHDPRDHFFGISGLYQRLFDRAPSEAIAPDYTQSVATTFTRGTRLMLKEDRSLRPLEYANHRMDEANAYDLPSWVAHWHRAHDWVHDPFPLNPKFRASNHKRFTAFESAANSSKLIVQGLAITTIRSHLPASRTADDLARVIGRAAQAISKHPLESRRSVLISELGVALLAGETHLHEIVTPKDLEPMDDLYAHQSANGGLASIDDFDRKSPAGELLSALNHACWQRCFFITAIELLGLGPQTMVDGDEVVVLFGSRVPFVVRRREGTDEHEVIGQAYVHGIMFGEAMQQIRNGFREATTFYLT